MCVRVRKHFSFGSHVTIDNEVSTVCRRLYSNVPITQKAFGRHAVPEFCIKTAVSFKRRSVDIKLRGP